MVVLPTQSALKFMQYAAVTLTHRLSSAFDAPHVQWEMSCTHCVQPPCARAVYGSMVATESPATATAANAAAGISMPTRRRTTRRKVLFVAMEESVVGRVAERQGARDPAKSKRISAFEVMAMKVPEPVESLLPLSRAGFHHHARLAEPRVE
jgi:hypothetical protein